MQLVNDFSNFDLSQEDFSSKCLNYPIIQYPLDRFKKLVGCHFANISIRNKLKFRRNLNLDDLPDELKTRSHSLSKSDEEVLFGENYRMAQNLKKNCLPFATDLPTNLINRTSG